MKPMSRLGDVMPTVMAGVMGEDMPNTSTDAHVAFLRRCAGMARRENARDMAARLERVASRIESAVAAGQLLPVRDD
jgi:hypothetical protein